MRLIGIIMIYILIFWFFIYVRCLVTKNNQEQIKEEFMTNLISPMEKAQIYSLLEILSNCFKISNTTYWIISGTTLGSVRHGEMIPWDDDADVAIFQDDLGKVLNFNKVLNTFGYEIVPHWLIYKFRKIGQEYPFVDIFCYYKSGDKYIMNYEELRNKWPEEYYTPSELFPLKNYKFGSLSLPGPNYPLPYLDRTYPGWQYVGIMGYDHKNQEKIHEEVDLNQNDESHKLVPYKIFNMKNKKINHHTFMKKKYDKYHNKKILLFEE